MSDKSKNYDDYVDLSKFDVIFKPQHWFKNIPSGLFLNTDITKTTYFWYQCEKVDRKF